MSFLQSMKENKFLGAFFIFTILVGFIFASLSFFVDNSFWWDELYSVVGASFSLKKMFSTYILTDVHPPLHLIVLHFWITIFGDSEIATRTLSFIFAISSFLILALWSVKRLDFYEAVPIILFFISSWLFSYYAQENRAYSMMLLLSTVSTILMIEIVNGKTYSLQKLILFTFSVLLLSLTHYFGFIYGGLLLIFMLFYLPRIKDKILIIITGLLCFIWPIVHFIYGNLGQKTGDNFWIKSEGIETTITVFINSILPHSYVVNKIYGDAWGEIITASLTVIALTVIISLFLKILKKCSNSQYLVVNRLIIHVLLIFVTIIVAIDLHSPISTARNFIVLLFLVSLFFGNLMFSIKNKKMYYPILLIIIVPMLLFSYLKVTRKVAPFENHKKSAEFIIENNLHKTHNFYYRGKKDSLVHYKVASFYFENINISEMKPKPLENILEIKPPFVYFSQHKKVNPIEIIKKFKKQGIEVKYFSPQQKIENSSLVFYTK